MRRTRASLSFTSGASTSTAEASSISPSAQIAVRRVSQSASPSTVRSIGTALALSISPMAHTAVRRTLGSRSRRARSSGASAASSSIWPSAHAARRRTSTESSPSALPRAGIASGTSSSPKAQAAIARTAASRSPNPVVITAIVPRILQLAKSQQPDLAESGIGVLGQRAELGRRPGGLLPRHHARGDAPDAAALVAKGSAEGRQHLRVQRGPGAVADVVAPRFRVLARQTAWASGPASASASAPASVRRWRRPSSPRSW